MLETVSHGEGSQEAHVLAHWGTALRLRSLRLQIQSKGDTESAHEEALWRSAVHLRELWQELRMQRSVEKTQKRPHRCPSTQMYTL